MAFGNSIGVQGLFGSQTRPGMRANRMVVKGRKRAQLGSLGSLSGSSLGDDTPQTATSTGGGFLDVLNQITDAAPAAAVAAQAQVKAAASANRTKTYLLLGGGALALYLIFRKRPAAAPATP